MSTVETPEVTQVGEPKLEVLDFLKANGYELTGRTDKKFPDAGGLFVWDIYRGNLRNHSSRVGAVFYSPDNPFCNRGSITLCYSARLKADENGTTEISLNPDQIDSVIEFRKFLDRENRRYEEHSTLYDGRWSVKQIANFLKQEGLVKRLEEATVELDKEPAFIQTQRDKED